MKNIPNGNGHELAADIEPMLTPEQVAKILAISKATLCRLTAADVIPHKRIGKRVVRYRRTEIEEWISRKKQ